LSEVLTQSGPQPALDFFTKEMHSSKASFLKGLTSGKPGNDLEQCKQQLKALVACPHPKIAKLEQVVLSHFEAMNAASKTDTSTTDPSGLNAKTVGSISRVIIFTTLRDSVQEIVDVLGRHSPVIKPR
jgi:ERCC4-related helicase